jgi:hypothetical protein
MRVTIETPGSYVEKWWRADDRNVSEAEQLGFVLAAALYAVGPHRLDEVLGCCIVALSDHHVFSPNAPAADAVGTLCRAADAVVTAWRQYDAQPARSERTKERA